MKRIIIEYPEAVECNMCRKMIKPDVNTWAVVYLREGAGDVMCPRCEDCQDKSDEG